MNEKVTNRIPPDIEQIQFDLLVMGGGINGCGIARDASERGLKVLLVEKNDYGSGCTYASSRLIHGGLRYLEHFEFPLVFESLHERTTLLKNANHLVKPIQMLLPVYKTDKRPLWMIRMGMILYDLLSIAKNEPSHKILSKEETQKIAKSISSDDLLGTALYYDAQVILPERVCIENILLANRNSAITLNHCEVSKINIEEKSIKSVDFRDHLTGRSFNIKSKFVINSAGPWVDVVSNRATKNIGRKIGGTKGSHIIVNKFTGAIDKATYVAASDGRPFFIIPWLGKYLIGTTDISFDDSLETLSPSADEIEYLLDQVNRVYTKANLTKKDVLSAYIGVRPLPYQPDIQPAKKTRKHIIFDHKNEGIENYISIIGGKLTTYRNLSEQAIDYVLKKMSMNYVSTKTKKKPLPGCVEINMSDYVKKAVKNARSKFGLDSTITKNLISIYGKMHEGVLELVNQSPIYGYMISNHSLDIKAQIYYSILNESAFTISDILFRRTTLGFSRETALSSIDSIVEELKNYYDYTDEEINSQKENVFIELEKRLISV